ncbi:MAG: hypothetical protein ABID54_00360 [Pseudomonadota bacterium]
MEKKTEDKKSRWLKQRKKKAIRKQIKKAYLAYVKVMASHDVFWLIKTARICTIAGLFHTNCSAIISANEVSGEKKEEQRWTSLLRKW